MWLLRRFSTRLQTEWSKDYRYVLGSAYKYQTSELIEITSMLSETSGLDVIKLSANENVLHDFFLIMTDRIYSMSAEELISISRNIFLNADVRDAAVKTPWWLDAASRFAKFKKSLSTKDLAFVNTTLAKMRLNHKKFQHSREELLKEMEKRQLSSNWDDVAEIIWPYMFGATESSFLDKSVSFIMKNATVDNINPDTLARIYGFIKRTKVKSEAFSTFFEDLTTRLLEKRWEPECLINVLNFTIPMSILSPELHKLVEMKLLSSIEGSLVSVFFTRLMKAYLFTPFATEDMKKYVESEVEKQHKDFSPEELVHAGIIASRTRNNDLLELLEKQFWVLMAPKNLNVLSQVRCRNMLEMIYLSGFSMQNFFRSLAQYIIRLFSIINPDLSFCARIALLFSHAQYNQASLYSQLSTYFFRVRNTFGISSRDICLTVIAMLECPDVSTDVIVKSLDSTVFYSINTFEVEEIMKAIYGLVRLNRCSPELLMLAKKRILEQAFNCIDDEAMALSVFAFAQYNHPDYMLRVTSPVKRILKDFDKAIDKSEALLHEQPKISPLYRSFLRRPAKIPATSIVQVCMPAASQGFINEIWTTELIAKLESYNYNPSFVGSIAPPSRVARLLRDSIPYATDLDLYHYHVLLNTLAVLYSYTMSEQAAVEKASKKALKYPRYRHKNTEKYRYPVDNFFKDEFKLLMKNTFTTVEFDTSDALGNGVEARVPHMGVFLLVDKEDYVYLSNGYETVTGTEDLLALVKLKIRVIKMQEPRVCVIPRGLWDGLSTSERVKFVKTSDND